MVTCRTRESGVIRGVRSDRVETIKRLRHLQLVKSYRDLKVSIEEDRGHVSKRVSDKLFMSHTSGGKCKTTNIIPSRKL